jgi:hypothetical protein
VVMAVSVAMLVALALLAALLLFGGGRAGPRDADADRSSGATRHGSVSRRRRSGGRRHLLLLASGLAVIPLVAACAGGDETGPLSSRVRAWEQASGIIQDVRGVDADTAKLDAVVARGGAGAIRTVCAVLSDDASNAYQELPSPDATVTRELADGLDDAAKAADLCYRDAARLASERRIAPGLAALLAATRAALAQATDRLASVGQGGSASRSATSPEPITATTARRGAR